MYDINFIKKRLVPESRKKVISAIMSASALALGLTLTSIGSMSLSDFRASNVYASEIIELREHMTAKYPGIPSEDELETIIGKTEPYLKDVGKMVDKRVTVAPIWERVAAAVPEGIWLTRVSVSDPRETGDEMMRGGSKSFKGIMIAGVALAGSGPEGDQAVAQFVENLESDEELIGAISAVEFMGTGLEQVGGTSVVGFEITCPF